MKKILSIGAVGLTLAAGLLSGAPPASAAVASSSGTTTAPAQAVKVIRAGGVTVTTQGVKAPVSVKVTTVRGEQVIKIRACSPQDCRTGTLNCEVHVSRPNITKSAWNVTGHGWSRCVNGRFDRQVKRQWLHGVLRKCTKVAFGHDPCVDQGFPGAEDASIATAPPRKSHIKLSTTCGSEGNRHYYDIRYAQSIEPADGGKVVVRGNGPNSDVKTCGSSGD
jgi:hypothetical protein